MSLLFAYGINSFSLDKAHMRKALFHVSALWLKKIILGMFNKTEGWGAFIVF